MTHRLARVHELHQGPIKGLEISASRIVTGGADGVIRVMSPTGEHLSSTKAHRNIVNSVALSADGLVASGSRDHTVRLFDPAKGRSYVVGEHDHWVMSVAWSPDGSKVASGSEDGTLGLWEPEGASVTRVGLGRPVNSVDWRGDVIATVTGDGMLHLLDETGEIRRSVGGALQIPWSVALSPDAARVAWTGRDRRLRIAPVDGGEPTVIPAHTDQAWSVAWDAAGARLATSGADGVAAIWDATGSAIERITTSAWIRRAVFRGPELLLASENGELLVFADDRLPAREPLPVVIPDEPEQCGHWDPVVDRAGPRPMCAECGSRDEPRLCVTCGYIGCCESQLAHATKHWLATGHPNTIPAVPGRIPWRWCYADDMYVR